MLSDLTDAHSDDRATPWLTRAASRQPNRGCGRVIRISRRCSTNPSPISAIRHRARGRSCARMWNLAPSISLLRVIAEGAGR